MFFGNSRMWRFKIIWFYYEQYGKNQYKKNAHNQHNSVLKVLRLIADPLITPLIFIFLFCREKAHDSKELSRENPKRCRGSRITTN